MARDNFTPPNDVRDSGPHFSMIPHELLEDGLSANAIAVYAHLARYADWSTRLAHPSRKKLMEHLGYKSYKPIDNAVRELQEAGWLRVCQRWVKHEDGSTVSRLGRRPGEEWAQSSNGYIVVRNRLERHGVFPVVDRGGRRESTPPSDSGTPPLLTPVHTNNNQENDNQENKKANDQTKFDQELRKSTRGQINTSHEKPTRKSYSEDFEKWWATYPRKVGKAKAAKDWQRATKRINQDDLIEATQRFSAFHEAEGTQPQFIPHPSTWLNRDGWDDELTPSKPKGNGNDIKDWLGDDYTPGMASLAGIFGSSNTYDVIDADYWEEREAIE